ncbi:TetR/AcrR family transcriptional regulator [Kitasatospora sp. NBC_00240]|uniref:TetR/AcrR family transcriptional regulator n=1 Tax=Kitasatospora sp. NBC_00240 TaxID=2903567 RepID=UPI00225B32DC|nr:TetR/AcrR family transcriptional regulator [Kitasatospora sp. NBC_00240]MCX5210296.1 TetR/AcrR family transcriptional regulator [Kitasatospora sp. NBC_00240]
MTASRTARADVRAELTRQITDIARRQLATEGAGGLSLRAVAREMGMVSSAVYRYFASRDELLTALIIDGYQAVGAAVEQADASRPAEDHAGRWLAVCRALRGWAVAHPHEYALLHGSPVPGYHAPADTLAPAMRTTLVLGGLVADAHRAGAITPPAGLPTPPAVLTEDAERVRQVMPGVPDDTVLRALTAWTGVHGWLGFELFGQFTGSVLNLPEAFDHTARTLGTLIGFRPAPAG